MCNYLIKHYIFLKGLVSSDVDVSEVPFDLLSYPEKFLIDLQLNLKEDHTYVFRVFPSSRETKGICDSSEWVQVGPVITGLVLQGAGYDYER